MKTFIYEIGVFDRDGRKHPVKFKEGLNVVTGKSSTGKSALIEIFDYCFGSGENTIPKGVITNHASLYYVALAINEQDILIARNPNQNTRAFLRLLDSFDSESIRLDFFNQKYFLSLEKFKKDFRAFFLDIDDVDESLIVRNYRHNKAKAPTPSIRSFASFMLQHQNLIANKHALFYRFDEKAKRDQVLEHIKIFLGLVDQDFFHLSQEKEKLNIKIKGLKRQKIINKQTAEKYEYEVESVLKQLYVLMGFDSEPLNFKEVLNNPEGAKKRLNELIVFEKINYQSSKSVEHYNYLKQQRNEKTYELRKLQNRAASINKHISQEENLVNRIKKYDAPPYLAG